MLCEWSLPTVNKGEEIIGAHFVDKNEPTYIVIITRQPLLKKSRVYIVSLNRRKMESNSNLQLADSNRNSEDIVMKKCDSFTSMERDCIRDSICTINHLTHHLKIERVIVYSSVFLTNRTYF